MIRVVLFGGLMLSVLPSYATLIQIDFLSDREFNSFNPGQLLVRVPSAEALLENPGSPVSVGLIENDPSHSGDDNYVLTEFFLSHGYNESLWNPVREFSYIDANYGSFSGVPVRSYFYAFADEYDPAGWDGSSWEYHIDVKMDNGAWFEMIYFSQQAGPLYLDQVLEDPDALVNYIVDSDARWWGEIVYEYNGKTYLPGLSELSISVIEDDNSTSVPTPIPLTLLSSGLLIIVARRWWLRNPKEKAAFWYRKGN